MIKFIFLMAFFLMGSCSLYADESPSGDQDFLQRLNIIKDPFEEGIPKPILVAPKPGTVEYKNSKAPLKIRPPQPKVAKPVIIPPTLSLQGVIVGEDMHEAIINDTIVPLGGSIEGAKVYSVSQKGVGLVYKGKKFFLKVE